MVYAFAYLLVCAAGLPFGFVLFGRRHAAGWVAGAVVGYGMTAFLWGLAVQAGMHGTGTFVSVWAAAGGLLWFAARRVPPLIALPVWTRRDTTALLATAMLAPVLTAVPFARLGEEDEQRRRRYRAYFTADYLWHIALTAELTKFEPAPRNPYLADQPLSYYWTYFNVPAVVSSIRARLDAIDRHLAVNALCSAVLFIACIYVAGWIAVPRAGPVAAAVFVAIAAASAEGLYGSYELFARGRPLSLLRHLNVDAVSSWSLGTLTIDSLPRSLWYTPQHAFACALALVAIMVSASGVVPGAGISLLAGVALGLALVCSPFLGGVFSLIYGIAAAWAAFGSRAFLSRVLSGSVAAIPVLLALGWCVASGTFESAQGAIDIGFSDRAAKAPFALLALSLGPLLITVAGAALIGRRRGFGWQAAIISFVAGLVMLYFVTLTREPVWIGWRAGQIILVTIPALAAGFFAALADAGHRRPLGAVILLILLLGVPTTAIDLFNASDIENHAPAAGGFRWTITIPRETDAAMTWLRRYTPHDAIVQMSIGPRGRETWTLIPSFAQRRMAAGMPISLVRVPEYTLLSAHVDRMYGGTVAADAHRDAKALGIDYIFVGPPERAAYGAALDKFHDPRFFTPVFWKADAEVIQVK